MGGSALFLPGHTLESAGVLEATLFDVKTGTLLFTVNERVHDQQRVNVWHNELKTQWMKRKMLETATQKLADQVVGKIRRLVVARPAPERRNSKAVVSSPPVPVEIARANTLRHSLRDEPGDDAVGREGRLATDFAHDGAHLARVTHAAHVDQVGPRFGQ